MKKKMDNTLITTTDQKGKEEKKLTFDDIIAFVAEAISRAESLRIKYSKHPPHEDLKQYVMREMERFVLRVIGDHVISCRSCRRKIKAIYTALSKEELDRLDQLYTEEAARHPDVLEMKRISFGQLYKVQFVDAESHILSCTRCQKLYTELDNALHPYAQLAKPHLTAQVREHLAWCKKCNEILQTGRDSDHLQPR